MPRIRFLSGLLALAAGFVFLVPSSLAGFVLVQDFDHLVPGPVHGQDGWTAVSDNSTVAPDPADPDNQVLSVVTESTYLYREMLLLSGTARMVFFRFRFTEQINCSFGLSDVAHPSRFDHFESELSVTNSPNELRINDDGNYHVLTALQPDVWYNCWILVDNEFDQSQVWMHMLTGQDADSGHQLDSEGQTVFSFRNGTAGDLLNFYIKTGGGSGLDGPLFIDDMYMEDTAELNLSNPVWDPSSAPMAEQAGALRLYPGQPSPFRDRTVIRFQPNQDGAAELRIYDARGRLARELWNGAAESVVNRAVWDGRDGGGFLCPAGVYFVRLTSGRGIASEPLVLIR